MLYKQVLGDKDTFGFAFALAGKLHELYFVATPPGAAYRDAVRNMACCRVSIPFSGTNLRCFPHCGTVLAAYIFSQHKHEARCNPTLLCPLS